MNLSKKTIKYILRILDNKCIEVPTKAFAYSNGGRRILTRDFEPKESHGMNSWQRIVYVPSEGYIDTASLNIYARQGNGERGIILGGYDSEERCKSVICDIFYCYKLNALAYIMPNN